MYCESQVKVCPYLEIPKSVVPITKLKEICVSRLKLYSILHEANYNYQLYGEEWTYNVIQNIWSQSLSNFLVLLNNVVPILPKSRNDCYVDDAIGHLFLGLASCLEYQLREFFIDFEMQWFQIRFEENISEDLIDLYLNHFDIQIDKASPQELLLIKHLLYFYGLRNESTIYKIQFSKAPRLFKDREVIIKDGILYFPGKFIRQYLMDYLTKTWKEKLNNLNLYITKPDDRIIELVEEIVAYLKKLPNYSSGPSYNDLNIDNIERHALNLFPLCMSMLHKTMVKDSHLLHGGRFQYATFLKNAGMPYNDAMEYFQNSFANKFDGRTFRTKRYFYFFSYCFGREGTRVTYFPQSCDNIISAVQNSNDKHGCPFAHYSPELLRDCLQDSNITETVITNILIAVKNRQYKVACSYYFYEKIGAKEIITNPNSYYDKAVEQKGVQCIDIEDLFVDYN